MDLNETLLFSPSLSSFSLFSLLLFLHSPNSSGRNCEIAAGPVLILTTRLSTGVVPLLRHAFPPFAHRRRNAFPPVSPPHSSFWYIIILFLLCILMRCGLFVTVPLSLWQLRQIWRHVLTFTLLFWCFNNCYYYYHNWIGSDDIKLAMYCYF